MALSRNLVLLFVALLGSCVFSAAEEGFTSGLESVLDKSQAKGVEWDYSDGPKGPAHWGELSSEWKVCSTGSAQGPIDVVEEHIQLDGTLDVPAIINYHPAPAYVFNDGKTLEASWAGGIYNVHSFDYVLEKLSFHAPSEHNYFGESFALEVQFVHTHPTEGLAINTLVFKEGESNKWLEQFLSGFSQDNLGKTISIGLVDSAGVSGEDLDWQRYYRYLGSETAPPCSESPYVVWSLLKAPLTASKEQIEKVVAALGHTPNVRPIIPIGERPIEWLQHIYYPKYVDGGN